MQSHIKSLTPSNIVAHLGDIFRHSGRQTYLGEPVTISQHMLQGASLTEHHRHSNIVIAAALLHDIGHFTSDFGTFSMDDSHDRQHEVHGAKVLVAFFPKSVNQCVLYHVLAKRYLSATRSEYFSQLSAVSVHSLKLQGGPMIASEVSQFETNPYLQLIIKVRLVDDGGKVASLKSLSFSDFEPLLQNLVDEHCTRPL